MRKLTVAASAAVLASASGLASAGHTLGSDDRWYITPSISYTAADEDRQSDDGVGGQLAIGKAISKHMRMELKLYHVELDNESNSVDVEDFRIYGGGLDALWLFTPESTNSLYLLAGVHHVRTLDFENRSVNNVGADAGIGFISELNDYGLALRGDVRVRYDNYNQRVGENADLFDIVANLGLQLPLGQRRKHEAPEQPLAAAPQAQPQRIAPPPRPRPIPAVPVKPRLDADGDGVADGMDLCPNSFRGARVNIRGCENDNDRDGIPDSGDRCPSTPPNTLVNSTGCELDSDLDGVPNSVDRCPNSQPGLPVNNQGCSQDSDADGVADLYDQCPGTPGGVKVSANGCPMAVAVPVPAPQAAPALEVGRALILDGVEFHSGSARLTAHAKRVLDGLAARIKAEFPGATMELAGHTDNQGAAATNQRLSQRRADAVRTYLHNHGIARSQLSSRGFGEDSPIADNSTRDGRQRNRRVELVILSNN